MVEAEELRCAGGVKLDLQVRVGSDEAGGFFDRSQLVGSQGGGKTGEGVVVGVEELRAARGGGVGGGKRHVLQDARVPVMVGGLRGGHGGTVHVDDVGGSLG